MRRPEPGRVAPEAGADPLVADLVRFRAAVRRWLEASRDELPPPAGSGADLGERLAPLQALQRLLFDRGWARYGWPPEVGGLGGDARHRAVLYEELAAAGHPSRIAYEHVEILAPALLAHWDTAALAPALRRFLDGSELWCQGFSEPDAGSDLAALSTRATPDGDGYRLTGRKIWTSWAGSAHRCVVLARTGAREERHRGLTAFFVDLGAEGVTVRPLRQANGIDELAEVVLDDVWVPGACRIGPEGSGWQFGMDVLSCERSAFAWLRHLRLTAAFAELCQVADPTAEEALGQVALDLLAVRASAADAVRRLAAGEFLGPAAAPVKVALTGAEQRLYDTAHRVLGPGLALGGPWIPGVIAWQEDYLFSRAVSIYGGTRQMQLSTIARFLLGLPNAPRARQGDDLLDAAIGVLTRAADGSQALRDLEWTAEPVTADPIGMASLGALFRAQGRTGAVTPALGRLMAAALVGGGSGGDEDGTAPAVAAAAAARTGDRVELVLVGGPGGSTVVVDLPDGVFRVAAADLRPGLGHPLDRSLVSHATAAASALRPVPGDVDRARALTLARVATAHEILGVCERMMDLAVTYGCDRRQFGEPIGAFQAVQHLLAATESDVRALGGTCRTVLEVLSAGGVGEDEAEALKALAGRTGRSVLQSTLQVLGGIGFTWEHEHHRLVRRVLTLDALFGSTDELVGVVGARARRQGPLRTPVL